MEPAIVTEATAAPLVRRLASVIQQTPGTAVVDNDARTGAVVLTLRANNTGLTFSQEPRPGQQILLVVRQGVGAPWTWTPPSNMRFAGGSPGATATQQGHRDIYTLVYDGTDWNETARALGVR